MKIIEILNFLKKKHFFFVFFKCLGMFFMMFGAARRGLRAIPDEKISKKKIGPKNAFFDEKKP